MASNLEGFPSVSIPEDDSVFSVLHRPLKRQKAIRLSENAPTPALEEQTNKPAQKTKVRQGSYQSLGLNPEICSALQNAGYNFPTPIQRKVIPHIISGADVVAMARTGSGKTAAFLAPILHNLSQPISASAARNNGPRALIVSPTRELALQTFKFSRLYTRNAPIRTAVVVGGAPLTTQFESLAVCPPLLIATPGRLLQLLAEMGSGTRKALTLSTTEVVVLDEADRMFEGTLAVETAALLAQLRDSATESLTGRQTVLVSATMPHALAEFSRTRLRPNLKVVRLDVDRSLSPSLATAFLLTRADFEKDAALQCLIRRLCEKKRSVIIFAATHRRVEYLTALLRSVLAARVVCVHGNLDQVARVDAVAKFRKGAADVLVVTDVAARGIDLPSLDVVVNYDFPQTPKLFVHRVGRVARAGSFGYAFSLIAPDELPFVLDTFLFLGHGVKFARGDTAENPDPLVSQAYAIESSFELGSLPKGIIDEEVEMTRKAVDDVDVDKLYTGAKNAHKLYTKTRGTASGESVRRAKALFDTEDGGRRGVEVHSWFSVMESAIEREASRQAALLSVWRPKECLVDTPSAHAMRRRRARKGENQEEFADGSYEGVSGMLADGNEPSINASVQKLSRDGAQETKRKASARQIAMSSERKNFFLPIKQETKLRVTEKAFKVDNGGGMDDSLNAYRELNNAAVDLNADSNADLLRTKHVNGNAKYWDRVSKKFIKGGVTDATSKRNLHVASREARARANAGRTYATEDGVLFKKWFSKNRKNVEQLAERIGAMDNETVLSQNDFHSGLSNNDFRKGAIGRKARIAMAARRKAVFQADKSKDGNMNFELRTADEIRKTRKMKRKTEARQQAHLDKKNGKGKQRKNQHIHRPQRGSSKSKLIVRRR